MNIHEYQAKELLRSFGVPVADGQVVLDRKTASSVELPGGPHWVVKAQIHAGGVEKGIFWKRPLVEVEACV